MHRFHHEVTAYVRWRLEAVIQMGIAGGGSFASIHAPCPIRESHLGTLIVRSCRMESVFNRLMAPFGPHGFPITIAIAAAKNGNGTDTAARNQTNRAGMNGISQRIMRWKANSAQATT